MFIACYRLLYFLYHNYFVLCCVKIVLYIFDCSLRNATVILISILLKRKYFDQLLSCLKACSVQREFQQTLCLFVYVQCVPRQGQMLEGIVSLD